VPSSSRRRAAAALRALTARVGSTLPALRTLATTLRPTDVSLPRPRRTGPPGQWLLDQRTSGLGGRAFDVYLPAGHRRRSRLPMVLLLHGCHQTAADFAEATRFSTVADRDGIILVLPHQESRHHSQGCWHWYESRHQRRGSGEPAALAAITRQVAAEDTRWRVDPLRIYVAGLSAGGAMSLILAAVYPDLFAAAGVHSAPPYRAATRGTQAFPAMAARTTVPGPDRGAPAMAPLVVIQGTADDVVVPLNGDRITEQWLVFHAATGPDHDPGRLGPGRTEHGHSAAGREYTRVRWYTGLRRPTLEYWLVQRLGHAWSGGRPGGSHSDPQGPDATGLMWSFFRRHRLDRTVDADAQRAAG
jgi:poly(hydroxyalkanoate) depolymerase family esterase